MVALIIFIFLLITLFFPVITENKVANLIIPDNGDYLGWETEPSIPIHMNIIMPTRKRTRGNIGYKYLEETVNSIKSNFDQIGVNWNIFAFSRSEEIPEINDQRFNFVKLPQVKEVWNRVHQQSLDWIEMMKSWKSKCSSHEIFLYLEDDFVMCENSVLDLLSIYQWAQKRRSHWMSIRTSFGFNGLFMQCRDIDKYLKVIQEICLEDQIYALDYAMAEWWSKYLGQIDRVHYTFRYNLFKHIGVYSSVGNDDHYKRNPKCFDTNSHIFNYYLEKFDNHNCNIFMMSPCDKPKIQKEFVYRARDVIEASPILNKKERIILMDKLKVSLTLGYNFNCTTICANKGLTCDEKLYQFANLCEALKENRWEPCTCVSEVWYGTHDMGPFYYQQFCVILDQPVYKCDHKPLAVQKLCPCQDKKLKTKVDELKNNLQRLTKDDD